MRDLSGSHCLSLPRFFSGGREHLSFGIGRGRSKPEGTDKTDVRRRSVPYMPPTRSIRSSSVPASLVLPLPHANLRIACGVSGGQPRKIRRAYPARSPLLVPLPEESGWVGRVQCGLRRRQNVSVPGGAITERLRRWMCARAVNVRCMKRERPD